MIRATLDFYISDETVWLLATLFLQYNIILTATPETIILRHEQYTHERAFDRCERGTLLALGRTLNEAAYLFQLERVTLCLT